MRRESTAGPTPRADRGKKEKTAWEPEKKEERQYGFSERIYLRIL